MSSAFRTTHTAEGSGFVVSVLTGTPCSAFRLTRGPDPLPGLGFLTDQKAAGVMEGILWRNDLMK